jgi:hypothetical protein
MTIVVDRFITSYYSEKMEIDFTEFINHENSQKYKDDRSVSLESCRDKEGCYKKYKDAYLNKGEKILSDSQINDERVIKIQLGLPI